jgi:predicted MFS family arabinose efflux permease
MQPKTTPFTSYQIFIIAILALTQFTIVLDFMVLSPLGAILMPQLDISPQQFATVVSAYAFSAGISGFLAAGFADAFDRKKMLLFFYSGFILGTLGCAVAPDYNFLLIARITTGIFGGVISAISFAIITDLFVLQVRGRVMGFIQTAFAASQVMGIPVGLYLANRWDWHAPFTMIVAVCIIVALVIFFFMKPINEHLNTRSNNTAFQHLVNTINNKTYLSGYGATTLLATGGFMLMPFASAYSVNNLGLSLNDLPILYLITGLCTMVTGPLLGKAADLFGKYKVFTIGSIVSIVTVLIYCNLGITPLWAVIVISIVMFAGVSSRIITSQALLSAIPEPKDRGAFMSINSSVQQISGGIATTLAGMVVVQNESGKLFNYDILGFIVTGATVITIMMFYRIHLIVKRQQQKTVPATGG